MILPVETAEVNVEHGNILHLVCQPVCLHIILCLYDVISDYMSKIQKLHKIELFFCNLVQNPSFRKANLTIYPCHCVIL